MYRKEGRNIIVIVRVWILQMDVIYKVYLDTTCS